MNEVAKKITIGNWIIFASAVLAFASLFCPWGAIEEWTISGWNIGTYAWITLVAWEYPFQVAVQGNKGKWILVWLSAAFGIAWGICQIILLVNEDVLAYGAILNLVAAGLLMLGTLISFMESKRDAK